jgi:HlyD family secretion protein
VSGTVEATETRLGFQVPGRVAEILVDEGDAVTAGQPLATLDSEETSARREQAVARLEASRALLRELERGFRSEEVRQAEAALVSATERLEDARRDLDRTRQLFDGGAVSREILDKAQTAFDIATSQRRQTEEQLRLLRSGSRVERIDAQRAVVTEAEAAVKAIDAALANFSVSAPVNGIVSVRHSEPNEIVAPGQPVLTLMNPGDRWVRIYIPEDRIGDISLGNVARISADTWPDRSFEGRVVYIASEAEFTPKTVQTTEERVRLVYAVKVRITGDLELALKPGMPVDVEVAAGAAPTDWKG